VRTGAPPLMARAWPKFLTVVIEKLLRNISEFTGLSQRGCVRRKNLVSAFSVAVCCLVRSADVFSGVGSPRCTGASHGEVLVPSIRMRRAPAVTRNRDHKCEQAQLQ
jgi:hypothetical protein